MHGSFKPAMHSKERTSEKDTIRFNRIDFSKFELFRMLYYKHGNRSGYSDCPKHNHFDFDKHSNRSSENSHRYGTDYDNC
jgi:hypothetical protein